MEIDRGRPNPAETRRMIKALRLLADLVVPCVYSQVSEHNTAVTAARIRAGADNALEDTLRTLGISTPDPAPKPVNPRQLQLEVY